MFNTVVLNLGVVTPLGNPLGCKMIFRRLQNSFTTIDVFTIEVHTF